MPAAVPYTTPLLRMPTLISVLEPDLPLASANSDMIRWGRVLLSHTLDAPRSS